MKRVCAWCKCELGKIDSLPEQERLISHGICQDCLKELIEQMGQPFHEFLDSLGVPVLVMNSDFNVLTLNTHALQLTGKDLSELKGFPAGISIKCPFASNKEMCGSKVHCKSCTINQTVIETFETGKSFERIAAFPDNQMFDPVKTNNIRISTEKNGDFVFLKIEEQNETSHK